MWMNLSRLQQRRSTERSKLRAEERNLYRTYWNGCWDSHAGATSLCENSVNDLVCPCSAQCQRPDPAPLAEATELGLFIWGDIMQLRAASWLVVRFPPGFQNTRATSMLSRDGPYSTWSHASLAQTARWSKSWISSTYHSPLSSPECLLFSLLCCGILRQPSPFPEADNKKAHLHYTEKGSVMQIAAV